MSWLPLLVKASYFVAALLFILGIKRMASPVTARKGIIQAGWGMVIATLPPSPSSSTRIRTARSMCRPPT